MKILSLGTYLIVFCLPLYLVRFTIFGIPTTALEILIYVLFVLWLIKGFRFGEFKKLLIANHSLFIAVILILIGVSLATVSSSDLRTSAGIWKAWFVDPILFFTILVSVIKNSEQIKKVLFSLFLSGTVISIIALIYLILGKLDPIGRLQAFYNSPNYLAMYLAPALIIGLSLLIFRNPKHLFCSAVRGRPYNPPIIFKGNDSPLKSQKQCFRFLLSVILLVIVLFFTKSYGVWLGIIVAVCFGLLLNLKKYKNKKTALIVLCLALVIIFALGYLKFISVQGESSYNARLIIWQKALEIFKTHPISGIGPGTFGNYFLPYPQWGVPQPHNIFLAFLLQTGILGFIGFVWLIIWFFRTGLKKITTLNVVIMGVMVYILVHGLVDTIYWKNDLSVLFWTVVGLLVILKDPLCGEDLFIPNDFNDTKL